MHSMRCALSITLPVLEFALIVCRDLWPSMQKLNCCILASPSSTKSRWQTKISATRLERESILIANIPGLKVLIFRTNATPCNFRVNRPKCIPARWAYERTFCALWLLQIYKLQCWERIHFQNSLSHPANCFFRICSAVVSLYLSQKPKSQSRKGNKNNKHGDRRCYWCGFWWEAFDWRNLIFNSNSVGRVRISNKGMFSGTLS